MPLRRAPGIKLFPACGWISAMRGSFAWDYGTGSVTTRLRTLRDGRRISVYSAVCPNPVLDPNTGRPRANNPCPMHAAHDIHGEVGNALYAVEDGVIALRNTTERGSGGFVVKLLADDPPHREYQYSHLDGPGEFPSGTHVVAGERVGFMGKSGNAVSPHLHFAAREIINGQWTYVDVFDELIEALEIQEGISPDGQMVALHGLSEGEGVFAPTKLGGVNVNRREGDWVSCHVPERDGAESRRTEEADMGPLIVGAVVLGGMGWLILKSLK